MITDKLWIGTDTGYQYGRYFLIYEGLKYQ